MKLLGKAHGCVTIILAILISDLIHGLPIQEYAAPPGVVAQGAMNTNVKTGYSPGADTQMFPANIPPPPGAVNDGGQEIAPPPGALGNIPAPPWGFNARSQTDQILENIPKAPQNYNQVLSSNKFPSLTAAQLNGQMAQDNPVADSGGIRYPSNMFPPPPGAVNDGGVLPQYPPPPLQPPQSGADSMRNYQMPKYQAMFPPNMAPPPPGAVNDVPIGSSSLPKYPAAARPSGKQFSPAVPPGGAVLEPNYLAGNQAVGMDSQPVNGQNAILDPAQADAFTNDQSVARANPRQDVAIKNTLAKTQATAPQHESRIISTTNEEINHEGATNQGQSTAVVSNQQTEAGVTGESHTVQKSNGEAAGESYEGESSYDESQVEVTVEGQDSDSDYSFMALLSLDEESSESSEYSFRELFGDSESVEGDEDSFKGATTDDYSSEDESSVYSNLDWILSESDAKEMGETGEGVEIGDIPGGMENDEGRWEAQPISGNFPTSVEERQSGGSMLVFYCIPMIILLLLVFLAWRNYRGRIRRVVVVPMDTKHHDWRSGQEGKEQLEPMLAAEERYNTH